jgi:pimeloyl-ACP methyl ester carboxylesterase
LIHVPTVRAVPEIGYLVKVRGVLTRASAAIDRSVVRFMERRMLARGPSPAPIHPSRPGQTAPDDRDTRMRLIELAAAYRDRTFGVPSRFFPVPDAPAMRVTPLGDGPLGTQVVDLSYPSDYQPFLPAARDMYLRATENLTARARWWTSGRGRPAIVLLHGWGGGNHWMTERAFGVAYWLRHGYDVAAFVLPYHGDRAPGTGAMRSGALFPSTNPLRTNEAFGQAIFDLRGLSRFLRGRGAGAVGALGMSLGGYTTALWASIAGPDDAASGGIDFAVAMIPAVAMASLMWRHGEHSAARARAERAGITEDLLADAFAVHAPTTRPPRVPHAARFVIAGRGDRITPPDQAEALAAHWGVDIRWFDGGHLAQLGRGDAIREVRRELGKLGFAGREPRMPRR